MRIRKNLILKIYYIFTHILQLSLVGFVDEIVIRFISLSFKILPCAADKESDVLVDVRLFWMPRHVSVLLSVKVIVALPD